MRIEISKELDSWLVWEYPQERLKEDAPQHIKEEYEAYRKALEDYRNNKY